MNGDDKELAQSYDVGFTMEDPADIRARAQAEWEEQQLIDAEDIDRWSAGRDASTSQEFWDALDAADPISFAVAGGFGSATATSPKTWREAGRVHEAKAEDLEKIVRSKEASRRAAVGARNRRDKMLQQLGVETPTDSAFINEKQSDAFFSALPDKKKTGLVPTKRTAFFEDQMIEGALSKRPPGFFRPRAKGNLYWAMNIAINEGVPGFNPRLSPAAAHTEDWIRDNTRKFVREKSFERADYTRQIAQRRALVASAQADLAAHNANKFMKVAKGVGGKALKVAGIAGGAAGAAFMPTFMAMKKMAQQGKLDATLAYMSYDLKGGPLEESDLTESSFNELSEDIPMADKLYEAGVLSTDLHRRVLSSALREYLIEQAEIGQEGPAERYLEPFRMGE
tara:strand:- start:6154 stop:7341 length:1188 start_codon:yes stop_codon:yes gene_type:complete